MHVFLTIRSKKGFGELIKEYTLTLREESIKLKIKNTITQHAIKIGIFIGTNNEFINTKYWEKKLNESVTHEEHIFKLSKDKVCKKDISSNYLVVNAMMSNHERIDKDFQEINLGENFIYVSF